MKKHQKVLLGIMALSLAGGTGTAIALTLTPATQSTTSVPTDDAIYLYWGDTDQQAAATVKVDNFVVDEHQYRPLVVAPKSSAKVTGYVVIDFVLSVESGYSLPGVTVNVYADKDVNSSFEFSKNEAGSYVYSEVYDKTTTDARATLSITSGSESKGRTYFAVSASENSEAHQTTQYYTLDFVWDGTNVSDANTFGGSLSISQSYSATQPTGIE